MGNREARTRYCSKIEGIHFIDPEDGEHKDTIKNARRKLEVPMDAAMRCQTGTKKRTSLQETEAKTCEPNKVTKTNRACIVEAHELVHE